MSQSYRKELQPGETIFREGETTQELYMLLSGECEVQIQGQHIATVSEGGSLIGELSFLLGSPRTATVVTTQKCEFLVIEDVQSLVDTQPMLLARIARLLAQRLKEMDEKFVALRKSYVG